MTSAAVKPGRSLAGLIVLTVVVATGFAGEFAVRLAQPELDPTRHLRFEKGVGDVLVLSPRGTEQRQIKNTGDFNVKVRFNKYGLRDPKDLAADTAAGFAATHFPHDGHWSPFGHRLAGKVAADWLRRGGIGG